MEGHVLQLRVGQAAKVLAIDPEAAGRASEHDTSDVLNGRAGAARAQFVDDAVLAFSERAASAHVLDIAEGDAAILIGVALLPKTWLAVDDLQRAALKVQIGLEALEVLRRLIQ